MAARTAKRLRDAAVTGKHRHADDESAYSTHLAQDGATRCRNDRAASAPESAKLTLSREPAEARAGPASLASRCFGSLGRQLWDARSLGVLEAQLARYQRWECGHESGWTVESVSATED